MIRRCDDDDWRDVRRLHIMMALGIPMAVDVELNDVFATPDGFWRDYTNACARGDEQALFVAGVEAPCVGMGHVRLDHRQGRLDMLFVGENDRRRGIGTALVAAQEDWAHATGAGDLVCHIPDTSPAVRLAERFGWQRTEEIFVAKNRLVERRWVKTIG
ncbi:MAG: GNAT family N-acetyltransferase [Acidimicrobiales bacterium]